jgi:phosphatidylserine decarboxylase
MRWQTLREARWILGVLFLFILLSVLSIPWLSFLWLVVIAYTVFFFRDPQRQAPTEREAIVAAADGTVVEIKEMVEPEVTKQPMKRIAIFLSIFDVHTNRAPIDGTITYRQRYIGKFLDARHPDATHLNEYQTWVFEDGDLRVVVRQITGAIARRIVGWANVGQFLRKGDRFGMIRFGSRTEVYVPLASEITVTVGQHVEAGASIIARVQHA